jgi:hypothetical protein
MAEFQGLKENRVDGSRRGYTGMERLEMERKGIEVIRNVLTNRVVFNWNLEIPHPLPPPEKNPKVRFRETRNPLSDQHANLILVFWSFFDSI